MGGEMNIDTLIGSMSAEMMPGVYVFATVAPGAVPPDLVPRMVFQEAEGTTLILEQQQADRAGLDYEFACRMITLNIHSALDAVGFLARITTELARHNMGVNPVSGFYHDHLFVPQDRAEDALAALTALARSAG